MKRTLRPPKCTGCKEDKLTDSEYQELAKSRLSAVSSGNEMVIQMLDIPEQWVPMAHWR